MDDELLRLLRALLRMVIIFQVTPLTHAQRDAVRRGQEGTT